MAWKFSHPPLPGQPVIQRIPTEILFSLRAMPEVYCIPAPMPAFRAHLDPADATVGIPLGVDGFEQLPRSFELVVLEIHLVPGVNECGANRVPKLKRISASVFRVVQILFQVVAFVQCLFRVPFGVFKICFSAPGAT